MKLHNNKINNKNTYYNKDNKKINILMTIIKFAAALCLICMVAAIFSGCTTGAGITGQNSGKSDDKLPEIIIGSDRYPPFNYIDSDGRQAGIDVELAAEAFRRMGYKAKFVTIDWENKKQLVDNGEIDCIWGCFTMDGREDAYKWAGPYMISHQAVAVRVDSDIYSLEDLAGKAVAVQSTTKPEKVFKESERYGIARPGKVIAVQKRDLIYTFLSKGYVDAIAAHDTAIEQFMKHYNMEYRILDGYLQIVGLGVAFSRNDDREINRELTRTFREMRLDGTTEKIINKYLYDADKYLEVDNYEE